jgi:hypothetical protein
MQQIKACGPRFADTVCRLLERFEPIDEFWVIIEKATFEKFPCFNV